MDLELSNRHALVLGASQGLGLAVARALLAEGAEVTMSARSAERLEAARAALPAEMAERCRLAPAELGTPGAVEAILSALEGQVDILINNTGGPPPGNASEVSAAALHIEFERMVAPVIALTTALLPAMRTRKWGRILTIASSGVVQPIQHLPLSNTLRSSLVGFMKTLAGEVAADGITVNMLLPGRIATGRVASLDEAAARRSGRNVEDVSRDAAASIPAGRYGTPEEFGAVAAFFAGGPASYVTGSMIRIDGGIIRSI
jgi:3-oxoacyl-[acyl-carrier protein] reductase